MGVESPVNYVADFNMALPTATDPKSQGDDHLRLIKVGAKQTFPGYAGAVLAHGTTTGSSNVYVLTPSPALPSLVAGMGVVMTPNFSNTGAATLNISGLGAKNIKRISGVDVASGELVSGQPIYMIYDGTQFVIPFPTYANLTATSFSSSLPSQSGNAGKFVTTNGSVGSWDFDGFKGRVSSTVASYTFSSSDNYGRMKWLSFTTGGTLTLPTATNAAPKYMVRVGNTHATDTLILARSGGDTINGGTALNISPNEVWDVFGDGSSAFTAHCVTRQGLAPHVIYEEQYASGTAPTSSVGSFLTRNLNTEVRNVAGATISGGAVTLGPGVWHIRAMGVAAAPGGSDNGLTQLLIRNLTDSSDVALGECQRVAGSNSVSSTAEGVVTITSSKAFAVQQYITNLATFGSASSSGKNGVFARFVATRLGGA